MPQNGEIKEKIYQFLLQFLNMDCTVWSKLEFIDKPNSYHTSRIYNPSILLLLLLLLYFIHIPSYKLTRNSYKLLLFIQQTIRLFTIHNTLYYHHQSNHSKEGSCSTSTHNSSKLLLHIDSIVETSCFWFAVRCASTTISPDKHPGRFIQYWNRFTSTTPSIIEIRRFIVRNSSPISLEIPRTKISPQVIIDGHELHINSKHIRQHSTASLYIHLRDKPMERDTTVILTLNTSKHKCIPSPNEILPTDETSEY